MPNVISVRQTRALPSSSFRFCLATNTLDVWLYLSHYYGRLGTFTLKSVPMLGTHKNSYLNFKVAVLLLIILIIVNPQCREFLIQTRYSQVDYLLDTSGFPSKRACHWSLNSMFRYHIVGWINKSSHTTGYNKLYYIFLYFSTISFNLTSFFYFQNSI